MSRDTRGPHAETKRAALTRRQLDVLRLVARIEDACENATTTRLAQELGLARQNLREHLLALQERQFITYDARPRQTATVRLTDRGRAATGTGGYPLIGEVAAGQPILADQHVERLVTRLEDLLNLREGDFLLRVRGDSMTGAGIYDGDIVAIRPSEERPLNGEIVLVLVPGENTATLKRWHLEGHTVTLVSDNADYAPMRYPLDDVRLQGQLIGHVGAARPRRMTLP